ncbi:hypothetical protein P280DRAFT_118496 [Massarina eburnea CBS 473.64]|uniref:Family c-likeg-protein-coupled receptor protein n=1 Tax=Massarina eburnea CBS 473.64 TaxID=1395130 RepID=A0A6A6SC33_9PLEO|nr:hypothetical protein P280DRAFT_118496 [Massarina eburnea CBS 473.64]
MPSGPPYRPTVWSLGGLPDKKVDIPITAVFLVLYMIGAAVHMTIFQRNRKRGHKFVFNAALFGFSMSRILTTTLRLTSTTHPTNTRLALAAQIFVAAGVLLLFIINLLWTQRILRSMHPVLGWHASVSILFKMLYVLIVLTLAMVITAAVQSFYTLRPRTRMIDRALQLYGATFLMVVAFLPLPILALCFAVPRVERRVEKFGRGRHRTRVGVLVVGSLLCCLGAAFRCGTSWMPLVPLTGARPVFFSKGCFYVFDFGVEVLVVYLYAVMRVDLRFWVPDGARGEGSYREAVEEKKTGPNGREEKASAGGQKKEARLAGEEEEGMTNREKDVERGERMNSRVESG